MTQHENTKREILPDLVLPYKYDLQLTPDLERFVFDGTVVVGVDVHEATAEVKLNAKELQFISATFKCDDSSVEMEAAEISLQLKKSVVTLKFDEVLPVGKGTLTIKYTGILNNQMAGFYRSSYKDVNGNTKMMASTQFESIDARRCLPCWDEPARKAIFAVTMIINPALTAFSNMPEKFSRMVKVCGQNKREIAFMDSPKMSSYLLAFVVGEFDFVQTMSKNGVLVRVYTPPGRSESGNFALGVGAKSLDLYDDFFGLPYPLPKLDMVAIPEFAAGAMENWGLVTYREVDLLIEEKTASAQQKQRVAIVVAHELAHQWFGNLVTMAWWDDLWLNEGFAAWCETYAVDCVFPSYKVWDQFAGDTLVHALRLDALENAHPIQVPIAKAEDVEEVFDAISYCKGAAVIRMANAIIGQEAFKTGLQKYMQKHQYSNTVTVDLWNAWSDASGFDVKEIMASWTEQMGFPLVEVKDFQIRDGKVKMTLEQSWFLSSGKPSPDDRRWTIPIFVLTNASSEKTPKMMKDKTLTLEVPCTGATEEDIFVLINDGVVTPMRVSYTKEMRTRISRAVRCGRVPKAERAALVMDAYCLAQSGKLGLDEMLEFLTCFAGERDYVVWDALSMTLLGLNRLLMVNAPAEVHEEFLKFARVFVGKGWEAANPGWSPKSTDGHTDGLLRGVLMRLVSKFAAGDSWLQDARSRFAKYVEDADANATELPDEYRVPVLQAVLSRGGASEYKQLMGAYAKMQKNVDLTYVQSSIGWASGAALKKEVMEWAISGEVKIQDFFYVFMSVANSSREGAQMVWEFFKANFVAIHSMVKTANPSIMEAAVSACSSGFSSEERASEIEEFFAKHPLPSCKRKIAQILEETRTNSQFLKRALSTKVAKREFWEALIKSL